MSLVRSLSQLSMGGADGLPHYSGSLQIPQSWEQPLPAWPLPYTPAHATCRPASLHWQTMTCPGAPVAGQGAYSRNSAMSRAIRMPVHSDEPPAIGSMTPHGIRVLGDLQGVQESPAPPSVIGTPINAASTTWRNRVCPNAPQRQRVDIFDSSSVGSTPRTPVDNWPSNIGSPVALSSPMPQGPDPECLRFAICVAKLDLAGPVTATNMYPILSEKDALQAEPVVSRKPKGRLWKRHTAKANFASGLQSFPETPDMTFLDALPLIDVTEFESPEKLTAPSTRSRARDAQKPGCKDQSRFVTN